MSRKVTASVPVFSRLTYIFTMCCYLQIYAADVTLVLSSDAIPYASCAEAIRLHGVEGTNYHTLQLSAVIENPALIKHASICLAIGSSAAVYVHKHLPPKHYFLYCMVDNPRSLGLCAGRQSMGVCINIEMKSRIEALIECMPNARKIGLLHSYSNLPAAYVGDAERYLKPSMQLLSVGMKSDREAARSIKQLLQQKPDVIMVVPDHKIMTVATVRTLLRKSLDERVPIFAYSESFVRAGALCGIHAGAEGQGISAAKLLNMHVLQAQVDEDMYRQLRVIDKQHIIMLPEFDMIINDEVSQRLRIKFSDHVNKKSTHLRRSK